MSVLNFDLNVKQCLQKSAECGKRGDFYKSLLYVRTAADKSNNVDIFHVRFRLAEALRESGNYALASDIYEDLIHMSETDDIELNEELKTLYEKAHFEKDKKYYAKIEKCYVGLLKSLNHCMRQLSFLKYYERAKRNGYLSKMGIDPYSINSDNIDDKYSDLNESLNYNYADKSQHKRIDEDIAELMYAFSIRKYLYDPVMEREMVSNDNALFVSTNLDRLLIVMLNEDMSDEFARMLVSETQSFIVQNISELEPDVVMDMLLLRFIGNSMLKQTDSLEKDRQLMRLLEAIQEPVFLMKMAIVLFYVKNYKEAAESFEQLLSYTFDVNTLMYTAISYLNCRNYDKASKYFHMILIIQPNNYIAKFWAENINSFSKYNFKPLRYPDISLSESNKIGKLLKKFFYNDVADCTEKDQLKCAKYILNVNVESKIGFINIMMAYPRSARYLKNYLLKTNGLYAVKRAILAKIIYDNIAAGKSDYDIIMYDAGYRNITVCDDYFFEDVENLPVSEQRKQDLKIVYSEYLSLCTMLQLDTELKASDINAKIDEFISLFAGDWENMVYYFVIVMLCDEFPKMVFNIGTLSCYYYPVDLKKLIKYLTKFRPQYKEVFRKKTRKNKE